MARYPERNTNAVSGQCADEIYVALRNIELVALEDPELMMIIVRSANSPDSLSEIERERFRIYINMFLDLWEQMIARQAVGLIQD